MLKKELKYNIKSLTIWSLILTFLFIVVYIIYPSIMKENSNMMEMLNQIMSPEILKIFNMDIISLDSVFGWVGTEGYLIITLLGGSYFAILGGTILLKEQEDHTIDFLYAKPISKKKIITSKLLAGLIYILIFSGIIALVNLFGLLFSNDFDFIKWLLLSIMPVFIYLFFYVLSLFISIFFKKTSVSIGINLGILFGFYVLSMLGNLSDKIEFIKYLSPFYYVDGRSILVDGSVNILNIVIMLICSIVFTVSLYVNYEKKELGK